jgi:hypothetical protein
MVSSWSDFVIVRLCNGQEMQNAEVVFNQDSGSSWLIPVFHNLFLPTAHPTLTMAREDT